AQARRRLCNQTRRISLPHSSDLPRLARRRHRANRARLCHRRHAYDLLDPVANDRSRYESSPALPLNVPLPRRRLRRILPFLDERQRLLGRKQTRRPYRTRTPPQLDRPPNHQLHHRPDPYVSFRDDPPTAIVTTSVTDVLNLRYYRCPDCALCRWMLDADSVS